MSLIKDLLYSRDNASLDIARLSSAFSVLGFWLVTAWAIYGGWKFSPIELGTGCAAIFGGAAGWIHLRQKSEDKTP